MNLFGMLLFSYIWCHLAEDVGKKINCANDLYPNRCHDFYRNDYCSAIIEPLRLLFSLWNGFK